MLTDWLIYLDFLEENNCNISFLRLTTPITFGIIECRNRNYVKAYGTGDGSIFGYGSGSGSSSSSGSSSGFGYGSGYGSGNGNGIGFGNGYYGYISFYDEEH